MSTELVPVANKVQTIRQLLDKSKAQIKMALPAHLTPDRMIRTAMTSIQKNPDLLNCTPQSLIGCVIQSAQLGLEPDSVLGHAYLVPYKTTCTFIVGYKGLLRLARRSGEISWIDAVVVHANDDFKYALGLNPTLHHIPVDSDEDAPITHVYAVCKFKDGSAQFRVMTKKAVDKIRERSRAKTGPWVTDYEEMAKKTVLRNFSKVLPCSVELERAAALDERAELGLSQDIDLELAGDKPRPLSKLDAVVDAQGSEIDVVPEGEIRCDEEDWRDIETLAQDMKVKMPKVLSHIMETMGVRPAEHLTRSRKSEVLQWLEAQKR